MSQNQKILAHLKSGRAIDPMTALKKYGVMRLAARILDLRQMGNDILSIKRIVHNRFGDEVKISVYKLIPKNKK